MTDTLIVGVGNADRGDDAAGLEVARGLRALVGDAARVIEHRDGGLELIELWSEADRVVVVDALMSVGSGGRPGLVHRIDALAGQLPAMSSGGSTHGLGVVETIELARALDRLPRRLVIFGIEGERYDPGAPLSPAVFAAVGEVIDAVRRELEDA